MLERTPKAVMGCQLDVVNIGKVFDSGLGKGAPRPKRQNWSCNCSNQY